jgi:energy-coupling factor transporter ATP-binding protein EcfA2
LSACRWSNKQDEVRGSAMTISRFSFDEKHYPTWRLNEVSFSDFNLLVGQSGVGKTKILSAIRKVCQAGIGDAEKASDCRWMIEIVEEGETYVWEAQTRKFAKLEGGFETHFEEEKIVYNGNEVVHRSEIGNKFLFNTLPLPILNKTQSAIALLQYSDPIAKLTRTLTRFVFSVASELEATLWYKEPDSKPIEALRSECSDLPALRDLTGIPLLVRAWILQVKFTDEFKNIESIYKEIFPTVSKVRIAFFKNGPSTFDSGLPMIQALALEIEENSVGRVSGQSISSGMAKTFLHLAEITLAPSGSVVIVDEFENSLGGNCLPQLTDYFLRRSDLQFILTSHHPYIINNIPMKYWQLVTRKGSEVSVKDTSSVRGLDPQSLLSGFVQLTNLKEYEEAIR